MEREIGQRLVARARDLQLSNAEVARRVGLAESRYAHYVSGSREPNFATFVRICQVLGTSPNHILGFSHEQSSGDAASIMQERAALALGAMHADALDLAVEFLEMLARRTPANSTHAGRNAKPVQGGEAE